MALLNHYKNCQRFLHIFATDVRRIFQLVLDTLLSQNTYSNFYSDLTPAQDLKEPGNKQTWTSIITGSKACLGMKYNDPFNYAFLSN